MKRSQEKSLWTELKKRAHEKSSRTELMQRAYEKSSCKEFMKNIFNNDDILPLPLWHTIMNLLHDWEYWVSTMKPDLFIQDLFTFDFFTYLGCFFYFFKRQKTFLHSTYTLNFLYKKVDIKCLDFKVQRKNWFVCISVV